MSITAWGNAATKNPNLNNTIKKIIKKLGPKHRHTMKRLADYEILTFNEELKLAESKLLYKWEKRNYLMEYKA